MEEVKTTIPEGVPAELPAPKPRTPRPAVGKHRYTISLVDGGEYAVSSDAKTPAELHAQLFLSEAELHAEGWKPLVERRWLRPAKSDDSEDEVAFVYFAEAVVQLTDPVDLEGVRRGWPTDEELEDEDDEPYRRKPRKPY